MHDRIIGYLIDGNVFCYSCLTNDQKANVETTLCKVYWTNIHPYKQDCANCGDMLVIGLPGWCTLFESKGVR